MTEYQPRAEVRAFFDKPAVEVAPHFAASWLLHTRREDTFPGYAKILGLMGEQGVRYFRVEEAILFEDSYTKERWPKSRSLAIEQLDPGEVIAFNSRGSVLTFIKTQGAENIMPSLLQEVDKHGNPLSGEDKLLKTSSLAKILQMGHNMRAQLSPMDFRGERAFLISVGDRMLTDGEISALELELLAEL